MCHHLLNAVICLLGWWAKTRKKIGFWLAQARPVSTVVTGVAACRFRHLILDSDADQQDGWMIPLDWTKFHLKYSFSIFWRDQSSTPQAPESCSIVSLISNFPNWITLFSFIDPLMLFQKPNWNSLLSHQRAFYMKVLHTLASNPGLHIVVLKAADWYSYINT